MREIHSYLGVCRNGFFEPDPDGNGGKSGLTGSGCVLFGRPGRLLHIIDLPSTGNKI